jgi:virginiamycin A acetyltransferase
MTPTVPDPTSVHWPEMIDNQEKNTVFLKPLVTSPKIEAGEFTYYNDADDPTAFETRNVLYTAGPEKRLRRRLRLPSYGDGGC